MSIFSTKKFVEELERYRRTFAAYTLEEHGAEPVRVLILRAPSGGHMGSTTIVFTGGGAVAEYIAILGDLCPGTNGVISDFGYGVGWLAGRKSDGYLCEKFLRKEFIPEVARDALLDMLDEERKSLVEDGLDADELATARKRISALTEAVESTDDCLDESPARSSEALYEFFAEELDDSPSSIGMSYQARDAALLIAIQEAFARLYALGHPETT